ncbi:hypothetical protein SAMN06295937_103216 [Sphingopyxis flava]|uniref:Uncharacterized protein n=1 Tax=Sphingopyxis flava TaxID=1507287 RepID=A0A1T5FC15_9SPHN|nr:hypothetical protein SAMN06295937_103216 [Sphingopyxis flava]
MNMNRRFYYARAALCRILLPIAVMNYLEAL